MYSMRSVVWMTNLIEECSMKSIHQQLAASFLSSGALCLELVEDLLLEYVVAECVRVVVRRGFELALQVLLPVAARLGAVPVAGLAAARRAALLLRGLLLRNLLLLLLLRALLRRFGHDAELRELLWRQRHGRGGRAGAAAAAERRYLRVGLRVCVHRLPSESEFQRARGRRGAGRSGCLSWRHGTRRR